MSYTIVFEMHNLMLVLHIIYLFWQGIWAFLIDIILYFFVNLAWWPRQPYGSMVVWGGGYLTFFFFQFTGWPTTFDSVSLRWVQRVREKPLAQSYMVHMRVRGAQSKIVLKYTGGPKKRYISKLDISLWNNPGLFYVGVKAYRPFYSPRWQP